MAIVKDQNGVVWFDHAGGASGFMSRESYERIVAKHPDELTPYDELEIVDSHQQTMVDVDL